jgi:ATP-dependent protease HslVU (ClpYQ) peptidase subunit
MTTIATDGKSMAGDGQTTHGSADYVVSLVTPKVVRTQSGRIVGCCGPCGDDELFIEWLEGGGKKPRLGTGFAAIVLSATEPARVYYNDCTSEVLRSPYAIGSGASWALAAMDMGKSPTEAVAYAATRDVFTGGEIITLSPEPPLKAVA